jgi:hypothetical protein
MSRWRSHLHPADAAIAAIITLALVTAAAAGLWQLLLIHAALLAGYALLIATLGRWPYLRPLAAMTLVWTLYQTLGALGMDAMPYRADGALARLDTWLFAGHNPTFWAERHQTPARTETFAFFYGLFIPYINLSLLIGSLGRAPLERDQFVTGWVFTYCINYLGYIFLPAQGPGGFLAAQYATPLAGGLFYKIVLTSVAHTGGLRGVFPSLHAGSSLYLCLFDLRNNRLRGLTYLPVVVMIYGATIVLRYHYVTDLIAGTAIAASCATLGPRVFLNWAAGRSRLGLPALPQGEGDVLPALPPAGLADAAGFLPAN